MGMIQKPISTATELIEAIDCMRASSMWARQGINERWGVDVVYRHAFKAAHHGRRLLELACKPYDDSREYYRASLERAWQKDWFSRQGD